MIATGRASVRSEFYVSADLWCQVRDLGAPISTVSLKGRHQDAQADWVRLMKSKRRYVAMLAGSQWVASSSLPPCTGRGGPRQGTGTRYQGCGVQVPPSALCKGSSTGRALGASRGRGSSPLLCTYGLVAQVLVGS